METAPGAIHISNFVPIMTVYDDNLFYHLVASDVLMLFFQGSFFGDIGFCHLVGIVLCLRIDLNLKVCLLFLFLWIDLGSLRLGGFRSSNSDIVIHHVGTEFSR
jgi:hypothetical protein